VIIIKDDFDLIVHKLDKDLPYINIYPIGDLHIGSKEFNLDAFQRWKKMVMDDEFSKVVIVGDIMDMATKGSKTNIYEATMNPYEQKEWVTNEFRDFKDKILAGIQGNHEYRSNNLLGICPMYDVLAKLDLEDLYRPNMAFMKINLGSRNKDRQVSYTLVMAHGQAKGRTKQFPYAIDGMDVMVTGHFHEPNNAFPSKIVIDSKNEVVTFKPFTHITVPSFTTLGGYTLRGMYLPVDGEKFPVIKLDGSKKYISTHWV
jgi:predicted phosphodiesterase